jgi:hypothetical protein
VFRERCLQRRALSRAGVQQNHLGEKQRFGITLAFRFLKLRLVKNPTGLIMLGAADRPDAHDPFWVMATLQAKIVATARELICFLSILVEREAGSAKQQRASPLDDGFLESCHMAQTSAFLHERPSVPHISSAVIPGRALARARNDARM